MNHLSTSRTQAANPNLRFTDTNSFVYSDKFEGEVREPQSLHKYAYVHGDPIGMTDPTGMFGLNGSIAVSLGNIALGVTAFATVVAFYQLAQYVKFTNWSQFSHRTWTIDFDVIRFEKISNPLTTGLSENDFRAEFQLAKKFWSKYNLDLRISSYTVVQHEEFARIEANEYGNGEIQQASTQYYKGNPLLFTVYDLDGQYLKGLTSADRNAAAIGRSFHGDTIAHEIGHIFGLRHPEDLLSIAHWDFGPNNLMKDGLPGDFSKADLSDAQIGKATERIYRKTEWWRLG